MSGIAFAAGRPWPQLLRSVLDQLDARTDTADLGLVFVADPATEMADEIVETLRRRTGIASWVGAASTAIFADGRELGEGGALAVLPVTLDDAQHRCFVGRPEPDGAEVAGLLHLPSDGKGVAAESNSFNPLLIGGQGASVFAHGQIAEGATAGAPAGVLFSGGITIGTAVAHGLRPAGPVHRVTGGRGRVLEELGGRPAAAMLAAVTGDLLSRNPDQLRRHVWVGGLADAAATDDGALFEIAAVDAATGALALAPDPLFTAGPPGHVRFLVRDAPQAIDELRSLATAAYAALGGRAPRAALFYSSVHRGTALFGPGIDEARLLYEAIGRVPMLGMRTAGELIGGRLRRHQAVLALIG